MLIFWWRKSENCLQNVLIQAYLHILMTKTGKSSTKRRQRLCHLVKQIYGNILVAKNVKSWPKYWFSPQNPHSGNEKRKTVTKMLTGSSFTFCCAKTRKPVTKSRILHLFRLFDVRKQQKCEQKVGIRDHSNFLYYENRKFVNKKWNNKNGLKQKLLQSVVAFLVKSHSYLTVL